MMSTWVPGNFFGHYSFFPPPECFVVQTTNRLINKTINRLINHKSIILCCSPRHNQQTVSEWGSARPKRNHERYQEGKKYFGLRWKQFWTLQTRWSWINYITGIILGPIYYIITITIYYIMKCVKTNYGSSVVLRYVNTQVNKTWTNTGHCHVVLKLTVTFIII